MSIILTLLKESLLALFFRIGWKVVVERALTRVVISSARKLAKLTTNNVDDAVVEDIVKSLQKKKLKVADELTPNFDWSE